MTSREFAEWQEYYRIAPFGDDWLQASVIATANLQPWTKQKLEPDRFIPRMKPKQTREEVIAALNIFARMHNEAVKEKEHNGGSRQHRSHRVREHQGPSISVG